MKLFSISLVDDWRELLRKAWSVRLIILAGVLSAAELAMSFVGTVPGIPHGVFAGATALVAGAAVVARLVAQKSILRTNRRDGGA